ncbi:hypothetical protein AB1Y20_003121 [Prymnesium parvum]|uniref:Mitochondrial carrier protein n=1 Tax=Prymnesium parvum TaxID=97485 RepID=A0AB34JDY4_PRYPA
MSPRAPLAGAAAGACQVLAEHPLDSLKVRMQSRVPYFAAVHGGPLPMLHHTVRREGAAALLQGLTPRLLSYSAVKLSLFSLYEAARPFCHGSAAAAGALAGAANTIVSCPHDVLKSQLQVRVLSGERARPLEFALSLARAGGPLAFYSGLAPLIVRDSVGYACLFSVFAWGQREENRCPAWLSGGLAGVAFYLTTLPVDRVKTVLMTQNLNNPTYRTAREAWNDIVQREGFLGLYRGCSVTLLRTFVGQSVSLTVYSVLRHMQQRTG